MKVATLIDYSSRLIVLFSSPRLTISDFGDFTPFNHLIEPRRDPSEILQNYCGVVRHRIDHEIFTGQVLIQHGQVSVNNPFPVGCWCRVMEDDKFLPMESEVDGDHSSYYSYLSPSDTRQVVAKLTNPLEEVRQVSILYMIHQTGIDWIRESRTLR